MRSNEFYNSINKKIEYLSDNELKKFINNMIRKIPESKYSEVLEIFYESTLNIEDIKKKISKYERKFNLVNNGEILFHATGYENYEDGYTWDPDWIWEFTDEDSLGELIDEVLFYTIELINNKEYKYSKKLLDLVTYTNYQFIDDNGGDIMDISLEEIKENDLIKFNVDYICLYSIYVIYQLNSKNKIQEIYKLLESEVFNNIKIQDAFKLGTEVPNNQETFWDNWIELLSLHSGDKQYRLLKDALEYNNFSNYNKYLNNISNNHPYLYLDIFDYLQKNNLIDELINIGNKALELIDKKEIIRGKISLYLAKLDYKNKEKYIYEAYFSNKTIPNLLRIINNGYYVKYKEEIKNSIVLSELKLEKNESIKKCSEVTVNGIYYYLQFFTGNYEEVFNDCINTKKVLGWSNNYIQIIVYLFILLLSKDDSTKIYKKILNTVFINLDFYDNKLFLDDNDNKIFNEWKKQFSINNDLSLKILNWLENIIILRANTILENKYRNAYNKVAILIVSLDELLSSYNIYEPNHYVNIILKKYYNRATLRKEIKILLSEEKIYD